MPGGLASGGEVENAAHSRTMQGCAAPRGATFNRATLNRLCALLGWPACADLQEALRDPFRTGWRTVLVTHDTKFISLFGQGEHGLHKVAAVGREHPAGSKDECWMRLRGRHQARLTLGLRTAIHAFWVGGIIRCIDLPHGLTAIKDIVCREVNDGHTRRLADVSECLNSIGVDRLREVGLELGTVYRCVSSSIDHMGGLVCDDRRTQLLRKQRAREVNFLAGDPDDFGAMRQRPDGFGLRAEG